MENQEVTVKTTTELPKESKKKKFVRGCGISVLAIIVLIVIIVSISTSNEEKSSTTTAEESSNNSKKEWVVVCELKGNDCKKSESFNLSGNKARIRYGYQIKNSNQGQFIVYLIDDGTELMESGGIPEIDTQSPKENSETYIHKSSGKYYLDVMAVGVWVIYVEELQ